MGYYKWVIAKFGILELNVKEIRNNSITTFFCVVISFLIVIIGIRAGPLLFGIVGCSIGDSKKSPMQKQLVLQFRHW